MSTKHYKNGLPKVWPQLTADDIHRGAYDGPNGTRCLLGWAGHVAERALYRVALALRVRCGQHPAVFNDDPRNSKAKIAEVWNKTGEDLGYTVWCRR